MAEPRAEAESGRDGFPDAAAVSAHAGPDEGAREVALLAPPFGVQLFAGPRFAGPCSVLSADGPDESALFPKLDARDHGPAGQMPESHGSGFHGSDFVVSNFHEFEASIGPDYVAAAPRLPDWLSQAAAQH